MQDPVEEAIRLWIKTANLDELKRLLEMLRVEFGFRGISFDYTLGSIPQKKVKSEG